MDVPVSVLDNEDDYPVLLAAWLDAERPTPSIPDIVWSFQAVDDLRSTMTCWKPIRHAFDAMADGGRSLLDGMVSTLLEHGMTPKRRALYRNRQLTALLGHVFDDRKITRGELRRRHAALWERLERGDDPRENFGELLRLLNGDDGISYALFVFVIEELLGGHIQGLAVNIWYVEDSRREEHGYGTDGTHVVGKTASRLQQDAQYEPHPEYPITAWQAAVADGHTICGYWKWVAIRTLESSKEKTP